MALEPQDIRLLSTSSFRRMLEARVIAHTAQSATLFAMFILVVQEDGSSFDSALLLTAITLPSIILSVPAGYVVDILPHRLTLTLGYLARAAVTLALFLGDDTLTRIFLLAAATSAVGTFIGPCESATVPSVVPPERLPAANSWMIFTQVLSQVLGMVLLAPLLIKQVSTDAVFAVAAVLFIAAAFVILFFGRGLTAPHPPPRHRDMAEAVEEERVFPRYPRRAFVATVYLVIAVMMSKVLIVLLPSFTQDVLEISPDNVVFVAAPAAIGAGIGILVAPPLCRRSATGVATIAFFGFLLGLLALGFVADVRDFIETNLDLGISFVEKEVGVSSVITVTMILAIPVGFFFTVTSVASRVVLNQEMPHRAQARAFGVQNALADLASLVPVLAIGAIADVIGAGPTLLATTGMAIILSLYLVLYRGKRPRPERVPASAPAQA